MKVAGRFSRSPEGAQKGASTQLQIMPSLKASINKTVGLKLNNSNEDKGGAGGEASDT